jgi:Flagellar hook-length control protein FliK
METSGPTSGISQLLNTLTTRATTLQLQVGQQLQATVLDNSAGRILLSLGHRQVSAQSSLPFERGQALTVEVRSLGAQPVLRIISALQESPVAMAVRLLLPRHAASTPLLANLGELARNPTTPVPPLIREVARTLVDSLPTINSLNTAAGVKTAIQQSGLLLEHKLLQAATTPNAAPIPVGADYKANLVRLIQLVRNWPGSDPASARSGTPAAAGQPPVGTPLTQPGAVNTPAKPQPLAGTTTTMPNTAASNVAAGETGKPAATDAVKQAPAAATPDQVQRAIQMTQTPARPGAPPPPATLLTSTTALPVSAGATPAGLNPPPPLPGVVPAPQASVQATLDLINRLGNLRLDLLQQTEAALARVQLSQLASLPREGERGLVEWLFDIPVRRGDDIDFWSARMLLDSENEQRSSDEGASWSVQLAFDLPGLGPMQAQIQLHGERVSTHFWASEINTLPLLREHLHELRSSFDKVGLEVGDIDCQAGQIPGSGNPPVNPLISEKA